MIVVVKDLDLDAIYYYQLKSLTAKQQANHVLFDAFVKVIKSTSKFSWNVLCGELIKLYSKKHQYLSNSLVTDVILKHADVDQIQLNKQLWKKIVSKSWSDAQMRKFGKFVDKNGVEKSVQIAALQSIFESKKIRSAEVYESCIKFLGLFNETQQYNKYFVRILTHLTNDTSCSITLKNLRTLNVCKLGCV